MGLGVAPLPIRVYTEDMTTTAALISTPAPKAPTEFTYSSWRHGGWYVSEVRYASGACGCVSRNYPDGKWRIVCDPRPFEQQPTFKSRDEAAAAEWVLAQADKAAAAVKAAQS